jgi:hypothetical protein
MFERNRWRRVGAVAVLGMVAASGCASTWRVERLRELPVEPVSARDQPLWTRQRVLVRRFADLRTDEYARSFASGSIPLVNFVHVGGRLEYPDHAGLYSASSRRGALRRVGGLDTEMPYLVAHALPGADVVVEDELRFDDAPRAFDWIVEGRVLQATATSHASLVLGMLSVIGMPAVFARQQLRVEISVRRADSPRPAFSRVYSFDERRAEGLYYHHGASGKLARRSLKTVVEHAAADIVVVVAQQRARELSR